MDSSMPGLIDGAMNLKLTPEDCDLDHWLREVAQGTLAGLEGGHRPGTRIPAYMCAEGPLRSALVAELCFRSVAEEKATRAISDLVDTAPDLATMEFFATQLIDEARHARVFRGHVRELGVPESDLAAVVEKTAGADIAAILEPLEEFAAPVRARGDFAGGVVILTVLVEGVLAPAAELSERKWRVLDPAAAEIEHGAALDEIRHLTVGSEVVRRHVAERPAERDRLATLIDEGRRMWAALPVADMLHRREALFQEGLERHAAVVGDYEVWPGRRLVDTTPEERMLQAFAWSARMQETRLAYMGLAGH
jgi:hypothetical protein